jgi:hypothetical protein
MGAMSIIIPQGPNRHCGNPELHDRHQNINAALATLDSWCDGIPPLAEFVELVMRVPLTAFFGSEGAGEHYNTHEEVLDALGEETGHINYLIEFADAEGTSVTVRLRALGKDKVYQASDGEWPSGERTD